MASRTKIKGANVDCVNCGETFTLNGQIEMGQIVSCPGCSVSMEVISLNPVEVDWLYDEFEDEYEEEEEEDW